MNQLKPYNKKAVCVKCGGKEIHNVWMNKEDYLEWNHTIDNCPAFKIEHIDRRCRNCGYEWQELPLKKENGADRLMPI
jgi:ribosomal protein L40E